MLPNKIYNCYRERSLSSLVPLWIVWIYILYILNWSVFSTASAIASFSNDFVFQHLDTLAHSLLSALITLTLILSHMIFNWINVKSKNPITVYEHIYKYCIYNCTVEEDVAGPWLELEKRLEVEVTADRLLRWFLKASPMNHHFGQLETRVFVSDLGSWVGYWVGGCAHSFDLTWLRLALHAVNDNEYEYECETRSRNYLRISSENLRID